MKTISRAVLSAILLLLTGLLSAAAVFAPGAVFSVYPDFSRRMIRALAGLTAPFPFALWELLALLLILWAVYTLVRCLSHDGAGLLRWLSGVLLGVSVGVFAFTLLWGLGHFGPDVGEQIGLEVREYTLDELTEATVYYLYQANHYSDQVGRDAEKVVQFSGFDNLAVHAGEGYEALAPEYPCFDGSTAQVKRLAAWKLYSYFGTTGIFIPFTGESCVNPDTFEASVPFTMCHEVSHRMGFPAENDSNFCAYLACMANESPEFRYSGAYSAFIYCFNALYDENPAWANALWAYASEGVAADCHAASVHYEPYEGVVQDAAQKVNDVYLKTFQEEAGVKSYGDVADYLIAWYFKNKG